MTAKQMLLDDKAVKAVAEILARGNSAEIRKRKDGIVIVEIAGKIKHKIEYNVAADGQ